jgi:hypothetical protein
MIKHAKGKQFVVKSFVVYDRETGKIVHRHHQVEDAKVSTDKDRLLKFVRPDLKTDNLEVLEVEQGVIKVGKKYRVNTDHSTVEEIT